MNEKELQGTASQQSPNSCTRSSSFNEFKNPMIRLISCRASFATSKPCLGPCMEICTAGESSISRLISTSDSVQPLLPARESKPRCAVAPADPGHGWQNFDDLWGCFQHEPISAKQINTYAGLRGTTL